MKFLPKKLRNEDALKKIADGFKEQFAAADKISDPADRIEAMLELQKSVSNHAGDTLYAMLSRSSNIEFGSLFPTIIGSIVGGIVLSVAVTPLVGLPLLLLGGGGGLYGAVKGGISNRLLGRMEKEMSGHLDVLNDVALKTSADIDQLLKNRSNEIAASDKFDSIYDNFPEVRDSFIKTFNKAMARKELPPPPPPGSTGPKLAL